MKTTAVQLAQFKSLSTWRPQIGDFIIQHGWLTHWFGVINAIDGGSLSIIKAGLPVLLFSMDDAEMQKNTVILGINTIMRSRGGKFAVMQTINGSNVWYI